MPLSPIQIILLELFMDLAASAGFVSEPEEKDIYVRGPRTSKERILNRESLTDMFIKGTVLFLSVTGVYLYARSMDMTLHQTQAMAFTAWIFGHIALAYVSRSDKEPLYQLGLFKNWIINLWAVTAILVLIIGIYVPPVAHQFNLQPIDIDYFVTAAAFAILLNIGLEARKFSKSRSSS